MPTWAQSQATPGHLTGQPNVAQAFQARSEASGLKSGPQALVLGLT